MVSLQESAGSMTASLMPVLGALFLLIVGLIIARVVAGIVRKLLQAVKADDAVLNFEFFRQAQASGWKVRPSIIFSTIVKWFLILFTLSAVADKLNLDTVSGFMTEIIAFIPQMIVAGILLAVGFVVGQFVHDISAQAMKSANAAAPLQRYLPMIAKYGIIAFSVMAAATQVGIAQELIQTFFATFLQALALSLGLAVGLSFGLGGKEHASRIIERFTQK